LITASVTQKLRDMLGGLGQSLSDMFGLLLPTAVCKTPTVVEHCCWIDCGMMSSQRALQGDEDSGFWVTLGEVQFLDHV
jgi:hypothetical protein